MNDQNLELHYAKNIAKQRKTQRNIYIGISAFMTVLFIISATALGLACKDGRQKLSFYLNHDHTAVWGNTTIWEYNTGGADKISLYFGNKAKSLNDTKWDGVYPNGYFDN